MNGVAAMNENKVPSWQFLFALIGMFAAIAAAWMAFESRITAVEQSNIFLAKQLDKIDGKLDRLIENRGRGDQ